MQERSFSLLFSGYSYILVCLTVAAACEGCTFCLAAAAGVASLYADFAGMAFTVVVVRAVRGFAVDGACGRRLTGYVAVRIAFAFLSAFCRVTAYYDSV